MAIESPDPIGGRDGLESLVRRVVSGRIGLAPVSLGEIVLDAEFFLGEVPTRDRLDAAIGRLVAGGEIGELPRCRYVDARSTAGQATHRRISERSYAALFGHPPSSEARPSDPAVLVTMPTAGAPTRDEWRRAEGLATALVGILQALDRPARVMSILSEAAGLSFLILTGANDAPQRIRERVEPLVQAMGGSAKVARSLPG